MNNVWNNSCVPSCCHLLVCFAFCSAHFLSVSAFGVCVTGLYECDRGRGPKQGTEVDDETSERSRQMDSLIPNLPHRNLPASISLSLKNFPLLSGIPFMGCDGRQFTILFSFPSSTFFLYVLWEANFWPQLLNCRPICP